jgi:hypothetical protein
METELDPNCPAALGVAWRVAYVWLHRLKREGSSNLAVCTDCALVVLQPTAILPCQSPEVRSLIPTSFKIKQCVLLLSHV